MGSGPNKADDNEDGTTTGAEEETPLSKPPSTNEDVDGAWDSADDGGDAVDAGASEAAEPAPSDEAKSEAAEPAPSDEASDGDEAKSKDADSAEAPSDEAKSKDADSAEASDGDETFDLLSIADDPSMDEELPPEAKRVLDAAASSQRAAERNRKIGMLVAALVVAFVILKLLPDGAPGVSEEATPTASVAGVAPDPIPSAQPSSPAPVVKASVAASATVTPSATASAAASASASASTSVDSPSSAPPASAKVVPRRPNLRKPVRRVVPKRPQPFTPGDI